MKLLRRLFTPAPDPRDALRCVWAAAVREARDPAWYREGGVADTLEGRYDMVSAVLALVQIRMERSASLAPKTGPLTELFVEEMDGQLRQSGVGDLMVGKQVGKLMASLGGRTGAYRTALAADEAALEQAVGRNITLADEGRAGAAAALLARLAERLAATDDTALLAGAFA